MTLLLAMSLLSAIKSGNASRYGYAGDPYDNVGTFACRGRLEQRYGSKAFAYMRNRGVAHRTLPCGTQILLQSRRSGRLATCRVLDRGPYGARLKNGRFVIKRRPEDRGTWRGIVDLSPAVANMLGIDGNEPVRMLFLRRGSPIDLPGLPPLPPPRPHKSPSPRPTASRHIRLRAKVA